MAVARVSGGGPDAVLGSECAQHPDLEFAEHDVGRQVGLVAAEQGHEEDAPRDDQIDGRGAGEARGGERLTTPR